MAVPVDLKREFWSSWAALAEDDGPCIRTVTDLDLDDAVVYIYYIKGKAMLELSSHRPPRKTCAEQQDAGMSKTRSGKT